MDSYAMLAYFQNDVGAQSVQQLLSESASEESALFISCINLGEIAYITRRKSGSETAGVIESAVDMLPMGVVGVDRELALGAAEIKTGYPISYADCFALALAKRVGGTVVTGDPEFEKVSDLVPVQWLPRKETKNRLGHLSGQAISLFGIIRRIAGARLRAVGWISERFQPHFFPCNAVWRSA